jgi:hypothetical protein
LVFTAKAAPANVFADEHLEWGAFFNRLSGEPPPLVERSGLKALQLAKLVFFGDVVDLDDRHGYLKSSLLRPDYLRVEANVPIDPAMFIRESVRAELVEVQLFGKLSTNGNHV